MCKINSRADRADLWTVQDNCLFALYSLSYVLEVEELREGNPVPGPGSWRMGGRGSLEMASKEGKANRAVIEVEMERRAVIVALKKLDCRCWKKKEGERRLNEK